MDQIHESLNALIIKKQEIVKIRLKIIANKTKYSFFLQEISTTKIEKNWLIEWCDAQENINIKGIKASFIFFYDKTTINHRIN